MPAMVAEWICSAANRFVVPLPTYVLAVAARRPPRGVSRSGRGGLTGHDSTSSRRSTRRSCWPADRGTGRRPGQRRRRSHLRLNRHPLLRHVRTHIGTAQIMCACDSDARPSRPLRDASALAPHTSGCVRRTHAGQRDQPRADVLAMRQWPARLGPCRAALADHHACNWLWRRAVPPTTRCVRRALRRRPREHRHDPSAAGKAPLDRLAILVNF